MKDVRRKSADPAVNQLLIKAYRQHDELIWDRMDAMQPQDGFGRLGLGCTDCYEGPCRVNPFDPVDQLTACGRDKTDLAAASLLRRVLHGAAALAGLARERGTALPALSMADAMPTRADLAPALAEAGRDIAEALAALTTDKAVTARVAVNMRALKAEAANIVLLGPVCPDLVAALQAAGAALYTVCGNEDLGLPLLTTYDSQELPLLTGAVDLLVCGSQCVMPATVRLAEQLGIPVVRKPAEAADLMARAVAHQQSREKFGTDIPEFGAGATVYAGAAAAGLADAVRKANPRGIVYLGGCGNIKHTQDQDLVDLARQLRKAGYVVLTGGCAGTALAKAGLCEADAGLPGAVHLGPCYAVEGLRALAAALPGLPVTAVMPELAQGKTLAVAVALAVSGIPTLISQAAMPGLQAEDTGRLLLPVEDFAQLPQSLESLAGRA